MTIADLRVLKRIVHPEPQRVLMEVVEKMLKDLRLRAKFTQEEVAELMGVTTNTVYNWETYGKFKASADMHKLLDIYQASQTERYLVLQLCYGDRTKDEYITAVSIVNTAKAINHAKAALRDALDTLTRACEANPVLKDVTCDDLGIKI